METVDRECREFMTERTDPGSALVESTLKNSLDNVLCFCQTTLELLDTHLEMELLFCEGLKSLFHSLCCLCPLQG